MRAQREEITFVHAFPLKFTVSGTQHQLLFAAIGPQKETTAFFPQGTLGDVWVCSCRTSFI